jgi:phytoene/squalene synthetase
MSAADSSPAESSVVSSSVDASYQWCVRVAQSQAKNFYYSFLLLSAPRRRAMCAMYAFMRYCDDLSDDEGISDRPAAIAQWRRDLVSAPLFLRNDRRRQLRSRAAAHPDLR